MAFALPVTGTNGTGAGQMEKSPCSRTRPHASLRTSPRCPKGPRLETVMLDELIHFLAVLREYLKQDKSLLATDDFSGWVTGLISVIANDRENARKICIKVLFDWSGQIFGFLIQYFSEFIELPKDSAFLINRRKCWLMLWVPSNGFDKD